MRRLALVITSCFVAISVEACPDPSAEGEGGADGEGEGAAAEGEGAAGEGEGVAGEGEGAAGEGEGGGDLNGPPSVVDTVPHAGDVDVATNAAIAVTWSEPIDCSTVVPGIVVVQPAGASPVAIDVICDFDNGNATFQIVPQQTLPADSDVTAAVAGSGVILDVDAQTPMAQDFTWSFHTGVPDATAPTITSRSPDIGASSVATNTSIDVGFSEPIDCTTVNAASFSLADAQAPGQPVAAALACGGSSVTSATLTPSADLTGNATFTVTVGGTVADLAGNALGADSTWTFTTAAGADTTPPAPPTATNVPGAATLFAFVDIDGTKDALEATNVEARHLVDGAQVQDFTEVVALNALATWSATFPLAVGVNTFELRSHDSANLFSTTTTQFTVTRSPNPVADPTIDTITTPTTAAKQVIEGDRPAGLEVRVNGLVVVAVGGNGTRWETELSLSPGANPITVVARDGAGNQSNDVTASITYNQPNPLTQGEVKIEFDIVSQLQNTGDESVAATTGATDLNHMGYAVWVEGPFTERSPGVGERCVYDDASFQRQHIRYVRSVAVSTYDRPPRNPAGGCNVNAKAPAVCNSFFTEPDGTQPNFMAAIASSGTFASAAFPVTATNDRRDGVGHYLAIAGTQFSFSATQMMFTNAAGNLQSRFEQPTAPVVDGLTQASVNPHMLASVNPTLSCNAACSDDQHCVDTDTTFQAPQGGAVECRTPLAGAFTSCVADADCGLFFKCDTTAGQNRCEDAYGAPQCKDGMISVDVGGIATCRGESVPDWKSRRTFRWDLTDKTNTRVRPGLYAVWLELVYDGINPGRSPTVWQQRVPQRDFETCWDDANDDLAGQHRAVAFIEVDGQNGATTFAVEKPLNRAVPACDTRALNGDNGAFASGNNLECTCNAGAPWPCPLVANSAHATGGTVQMLDASYRGAGGAMRVEYCPSGACP